MKKTIRNKGRSRKRPTPHTKEDPQVKMPARDHYFMEPGAAAEMCCGICGSLCEVRRNQFGPTSLMGAWGKINKLHDYFSCPHQDEPWHRKAMTLAEACGATPSKRLARLIKLDWEDVLREARKSGKLK